MRRQRRYVSSARKLQSKNFKHDQRRGHRSYANYGHQVWSRMLKAKQKLCVA